VLINNTFGDKQMLKETSKATTDSFNKIKFLTATALITALVGCSANKAPYHTPNGNEVILDESEVISEPVNAPAPVQNSNALEEVVVTGTHKATNNSRGRNGKLETKKAEPSRVRHSKEIAEQRAKVKELSILREDSAQQIFKHYGVNPTISTKNEQHSTFAMDVDTVSYQIAKASLESQQLPNTAAIRVEEFVNNFEYNYASNNDVFSISAEVVPSPYRPGFHLLHLGVKAKQVNDEQRLPANLVLVADISGSMNSSDKMGLQKQALTTLVSQLTANDSIAIVTYSQRATVLLEPTKASDKSKIYAAIQSMQATGSTNVEVGLRQGYALAEKMSYAGHSNRVILTSDGLANTGNIGPSEILAQIEHYKKQNIFLTTVGVGRAMYNDYLLEQLANKGNGNYLYLADQDDIERVFVDGLTTQLQVVAKDAKIQLKFNPEMVSLFRQIGYENRGLQKQDFLDANKDGGEVGANQQVTALYEIKLTQTGGNADLANVSLSYKKPQGSKVFTISKDVPLSTLKAQHISASPDTLVSMSVAAFAEKLRQSYWSRNYNYQTVLSQLTLLPSHVKSSPQVSELIRLVNNASRLDSRSDPYSKRHPIANIDYDQVPLLR